MTSRMVPKPPDGNEVPEPARERARKPVLYMFGAIIVVGLVGFTMSFAYPFFLGQQIGPAMLPAVASGGMILVGALLLADELRSGSILEGDGAVAVAEQEQTKAELKATHHKLIMVGILTPIAVLLFPILGILPSLVILAFVLSAFVEKMPIMISAIIAICTFIVFYALFVMMLNVSLPFGIFGPKFWSSL